MLKMALLRATHVRTTILEKQQMSLETHVLQFCFKKNSCTEICTSMLKETIDYYNENKTDCY